MILGAGFSFLIGVIFFVLWVVFAVMGVIFFHCQNSSHTRKLNKEEREYIDHKYEWLKDKDIFLYHQIYNQTFELLKNTDCHKRLFESIFDKYFQSENQDLYEEFKNSKKLSKYRDEELAENQKDEDIQRLNESEKSDNRLDTYILIGMVALIAILVLVGIIGSI